MRAAAAAGLLLWVLAASALVLHGRSQVLGDVFLYEAGKGEREPVHFDPFPDLPADFGPEVPDEGLDGLLLAANPEDACQPLRVRYDDEPWVALISRSQHLHPTNCTFDVKVRNAELAGASAAIVYDDVYEALIIMSKPRDHPEPGIPAVFVSEKAGIIMRKLMTPGITRVRIVPVSASAWMSLLMSAFLGFLALTVVLATFYVMRSWSMWLGRTRRRGMAPELAGFGAVGPQGAGQEGLPACAIRALPILIYEGKRRRSSTSSAKAPPAEQSGQAGQQAPSAPVPIAAPAAAGGVSGGGVVAWMAGSPAMPETPQAAAAGGAPAGSNAQHSQHAAGHTAVVFIESDSESDAAGAAGAASGQQGQQPAGFRQRLASSSSAVSSGLISLASLAAAGSRRALLMQAGQSQASSPPADSALAVAAAAGPCANVSSSSSAGGSRRTHAVPVRTAGASSRAAGCGSGCESPTGSAASCRSSLFSTDEEDGDLPEVVQSWPGVGGMAHVVTGGPVGARGGATRHTCVVCLERYAAGDKVRVLPCQHRFHARCIDPWLSSRRLCPVCKHDASTWPSNSLQAALSGSVPLDTTPAAAGAAAAAGVPDPAGGVNLLSAPLSAGVVSLVGRGYWFRRLRARLARASRRRQQHQQQQLAGAADGGAAAAASTAATAEAAEAGLLQRPLAAVTLDVHQGQPAALQAEGLAGVALPAAEAALQQQQEQWQQRQQQEQQQRRILHHQAESASLQEPLLPAR